MALLRKAMSTWAKTSTAGAACRKLMGRAGLAYQFLLRTSLQYLGEIIANDTAEAIYMNTSTDAYGVHLSGADNSGTRRHRVNVIEP
jgi:hypothetical protein